MTDRIKDGIKPSEEDIAAQVEARAAEEAAGLDPDPDATVIDTKFIRRCHIENERGDGALFAALHAGEFVYEAMGGVWYYWGGHHWRQDDLGYASVATKNVADTYLNEGKALSKSIKRAQKTGSKDLLADIKSEQARYYSRTKRLNTKRGAQNCLFWAHNIDKGLAINGEEFDRDPMLLGCSNGVLELRTGLFRPGRAGDYITKAAPHEWKGIEEEAPLWESFLEAVFLGDKPLIDYTRRLFGYAMTGVTTEHVMPVFHGVGRNGKGTLIETLSYVLGPLAQPIPSEMLIEQRFGRSSSGPSPDVMSLKGLRLAFASETDEGEKFSSRRAKWLSGGDALTGRNPHDKYPTTFDPTHLLCLITNHLPHAAGNDFAFWQRIRLIPFLAKFVDKPSGETEQKRDKNLPLKLRGEASGILAWLMRGCLEWQRDGLNAPKTVLMATEKYQFDEDTLAEFLEACCYPPEETDPDGRTQYSLLYTTFQDWYIKNYDDKPPKKKEFNNLMQARFKRDKVGGKICFFGVILKPELEMDL
ncbi:MAG: phage/plasmid primase, P4 family [Thermodesulfobacteriota bacterium]